MYSLHLELAKERKVSTSVRKYVVTGATVFLLLGITGCMSEQPTNSIQNDDFESMGKSLGGGLAGYEISGQGGDAAELTGTLMTMQECVVVETISGELVLPVFPIGETKLDEESKVLKWGSSHYAELEGKFTATGGYFESGEYPHMAKFPEGCQDLTSFVVSSD